ncbi:NADPH-dependent oxidoreductase [Pseudoroseomonas globiformis]|uniref:NADPH-dependent oxidoreductase n=1 Tax=Teichococcus globiformis TaxID=2307229 RepID=A0ABV7FY78_9PROT
MSTDQLQAYAARYGEAAIPAGAGSGPWNPVIAGLLAHRSVRAYRPDPLPAGTLDMLVATAQSAATSSNMQSWSVVAVTDAATKAAMADVAGGQRHIEQCPLFLVFLADLSRHERLAAEEGAALEGLPFLETFLVAALDAGLAAQNAVVAAESIGLSTVYIGALRNNVERVAELLNLPPGAAGVFGLCVGYADEARSAEVKPRLPQPAVLHRERYDAAGEPVHRAAYDQALASFSARHEMSAYRWTDRALSRWGRIASLHGRDGLKQALRRLGFPLR